MSPPSSEFPGGEPYDVAAVANRFFPAWGVPHTRVDDEVGAGNETCEVVLDIR